MCSATIRPHPLRIGRKKVRIPLTTGGYSCYCHYSVYHLPPPPLCINLSRLAANCGQWGALELEEALHQLHTYILSISPFNSFLLASPSGLTVNGQPPNPLSSARTGGDPGMPGSHSLLPRSETRFQSLFTDNHRFHLFALICTVFH